MIISETHTSQNYAYDVIDWRHCSPHESPDSRALDIGQQPRGADWQEITSQNVYSLASHEVDGLKGPDFHPVLTTWQEGALFESLGPPLDNGRTPRPDVPIEDVLDPLLKSINETSRDERQQWLYVLATN